MASSSPGDGLPPVVGAPSLGAPGPSSGCARPSPAVRGIAWRRGPREHCTLAAMAASCDGTASQQLRVDVDEQQRSAASLSRCSATPARAHRARTCQPSASIHRASQGRGADDFAAADRSSCRGISYYTVMEGAKMTLAFFFPTNSHASRMSFAEKRLPTPGYSRDLCSRLNIEVRGAIRGKADRLCDDTVLPSANSAARWPCSSPAPPCALRPSATRSLSSGASSTTVRLSAVLAALTAATNRAGCEAAGGPARCPAPDAVRRMRPRQISP